VSVALDVTSGIMARFRTMAISPSSVLTGHVVGTLIQIGFALATVFGVAALVGYRGHASAAEWLGAAGILLLFGLAVTWLTVALGLASKTVEAASNTPMILTLLPFLGSGFVPPSSMPGWLAAFARNQPFTPTTDAVRGLLDGAPHGHDVALAIVWSVAISAVGFVWARHLFQRRGRGETTPAAVFGGRPAQ
jgi:ABC-2 type transport system permease protein